MKRLILYLLTGILFVITLGTLAHFFYGWSGNNIIVGLFAPVNESTWEHMKLLFFPMLLYTFFVYPKLKDDYPCILSSLLSGLLLGTALIPITFYTYTGILGYHLLFLDICTFIFSVICAFFISYRLSISCSMQNHMQALFFAVGILLLCFAAFTFFPPNIALFDSPVS